MIFILLEKSSLNENIAKLIGHHLFLERLKKGVNQIELTEGICSRSALGKIETGAYPNPSMKMITPILGRLGLQTEQFFVESLNNSISNRDLEIIWDHSNNFRVEAALDYYNKIRRTDNVIDEQLFTALTAMKKMLAGKYTQACEMCYEALNKTFRLRIERSMCITEMMLCNTYLLCYFHQRFGTDSKIMKWVECFEDSIKFYEDKYPNGMIRFLINISEIYRCLGVDRKHLYYLEKARKNIEKNCSMNNLGRYKSAMMVYCLEKGNNLVDAGNLEEGNALLLDGVKNYREAINIYEMIRNKDALAFINDSVTSYRKHQIINNIFIQENL